jgi:hypothetical protein
MAVMLITDYEARFESGLAFRVHRKRGDDILYRKKIHLTAYQI